MKRFSKLLLVFLLVLLVFTGCSKKEETVINKTDEKLVEYLNILKNYTPKARNGGDQDNEEFETFLNEMFKEALEENFISYHFDIENPDSLGIKKPEVKFSEIDYDSNESYEEIIKDLETLQAFDFDSLSYKQQLDYEILEYSFYESLLSLEMDAYSTLFSEGNDFVGNSINVLTEFKFRDDKDVEDYLTLLNDYPRYLNDAIVYTQKQMEDGIYHTDPSIDYSISYIDGVVSKVSNNVLIEEFENNLKEYGKYPKADDAIERNRDIVIQKVIPALIEARDELSTYKGKVSVKDKVLYKISREYAEANYILSSSNNLSIDILFSETKELYENMLAGYVSALQDDNSYNEYLRAVEGKIKPFGLSDTETLNYLRDNIKKCYKDLGEIDFKVSPLDETSAQNSVLAYYQTSPVDNPNQNIIRVNRNITGDDAVQTYTTLAHEGFPGHLYQNAYQLTNGISLSRKVQSFIGYSEGYAVYAQNLALDLVDFEGMYTKDMMSFMQTYYFLVYSLIDMGINYYGWSEQQLKDFLDDTLIFDRTMYDDIVKMFFETFTDMPGVYCSYGLGYAEFNKLRNTAMNELNDKFDYTEFNDVILRNGIMPFVFVRDGVTDYINNSK